MKYFSVAMLIVGTIIGAGFASGRELVSFFGYNFSPVVALVCGALIFLLSAMFMFIGSKINAANVTDVNKRLLGKGHAAIDILVLCNSFIVLSSMLAGMDALGGMLFPLKPLYGALSGLLCIPIVIKGVKGLLNCNKIVVPFIIALLVAVCLLSVFFAPKVSSGASSMKTFAAFGPKGIFSSVIYVAMNMMLASTVLTVMGKQDKKTIFISSAIAAIVLALLIFLLSIALGGNAAADADMPVLIIAKQLSPVLFGLIMLVVAVSIFTTMLTAMSGLVMWFTPILKSKLFAAVVCFLAALALSLIGFSNVVDYLYPVIGGVGVLYSVLGIIFTARHSRLLKPLHGLRKKRLVNH